MNYEQFIQAYKDGLKEILKIKKSEEEEFEKWWIKKLAFENGEDGKGLLRVYNRAVEEVGKDNLQSRISSMVYNDYLSYPEI